MGFFKAPFPTLPLTNIYEIKHRITSLKLRAAPGGDGITPPKLRNLSRKAIIHLTQLFNHLLRLGHFPLPGRQQIYPYLQTQQTQHQSQLLQTNQSS
jgi:hypothetical protein